MNKYNSSSFNYLLKLSMLLEFTQIRLLYLTIQVLNTTACFINIWYTPLGSVLYNLEYGLAILQRALVYSIWLTQPSLSKSKSEVMWQAMLFLFVMHIKLDHTG